MYKCQDCSYSSDWSSNLRKHEKFKHKDSEPIEHKSNVYSLGRGYYQPTKRNNLTRHQNAMHAH